MIGLLLTAAVWAKDRGVEHADLPPAGIESVFEGRRVALVVGIDDYADPSIPALSYAARDADAFGDALADPELGSFDRVRSLRGTVNRDAFWSAFEELTAELDGSDTFVLYFAGHGTLTWASATETALYLLPSDARLAGVSDTGVALADIEAAMQGLATERRVMVLDTCYSGMGRSHHSAQTSASLRGLRGLPPTRNDVVLNSRYEARLYAAAHHEPAREDEALRNGVYTHYLVSGWRSGLADLDRDGRVELLEAHWWAQEQTVAHTDAAQHPWMEVTQVGAEWLFLSGDAPAPPEAAILVVPDPQRTTRGLQAPAEVYLDGVRRRSGGLTPGVHQLVVRQAGETQLDTEIEVRAGERVDVGAWLDRTSGAERGARVDRTEPRAVAVGLRAGIGLTSPVALSTTLAGAIGVGVHGRGPGLHFTGQAAFTWDLSTTLVEYGWFDRSVRTSDVDPVSVFEVTSRISTSTVTLGAELGDRWAVSLGPTAGGLVRMLEPVSGTDTAIDQSGWIYGGTLAGRGALWGPTELWLSTSALSYSNHNRLGAAYRAIFPTISAGLALRL